MSVYESPPKKIAIVRLSALGDVCQLASVVLAMREQAPDSQITWIIGQVEHELVSALPGIEFIVVNKRGGWSERRRLRRLLRGRQFDVLCHMQVSWRSSLFARQVRARYVLGFDRARARDAQWLFTNRRIPAEPCAHVMHGFLSFAREIGCGDLSPVWGLPISDAEHAWVTQQVPQGPVCVVVPAGSYSEKNWLVDRYAAVIQHAVTQGFSVVLCGGPTEEERALSAAIERELECAITSLVGQTTLPQLSAVLARADVVVSPDTGPAHIASSQGTPVIGLYAVTPPARTGPYRYLSSVVSVYEEIEKERYGASGAPRWGQRHHGGELMSRLSVDRVIAMFDHLISQRL